MRTVVPRRRLVALVFLFALALAPVARASAAEEPVWEHWYTLEIAGAAAGWMHEVVSSDGETYRVQLFHAQRQQGLAIFRLQTNMVLISRDGVTPAITGVLED